MKKNKYRYPTDRLWTVGEAADVINVSQRTVRNWIRDGELPVVTYGAKGRRPCYRLVPEVVLATGRAATLESHPSQKEN